MRTIYQLLPSNENMKQYAVISHTGTITLVPVLGALLSQISSISTWLTCIGKLEATSLTEQLLLLEGSIDTLSTVAMLSEDTTPQQEWSYSEEEVDDLIQEMETNPEFRKEVRKIFKEFGI